MGDLLVVIFIGTVFFLCGFILTFWGEQKARKPGVVMLIIGIVIYIACWLFTPNNPRYHL